jgi:hypothetical protein
MSDNESMTGDGPQMPRPVLDDELRRSMKDVREFIEQAREHHARTGEWPPDPLLDEVAEMRRKIMAEHGNDWRKVLQWHVEQDKLYAQQHPDARFLEKPDRSAIVTGH